MTIKTFNFIHPATKEPMVAFDLDQLWLMIGDSTTDLTQISAACGLSSDEFLQERPEVWQDILDGTHGEKAKAIAELNDQAEDVWYAAKDYFYSPAGSSGCRVVSRLQ